MIMPTQKQYLDNEGLTELLDKLGQHLKSKQDKLTFDNAPTASSTNPVTSGGIRTALNGKQDLLVSGTNIKTVNNTSLLGSGNIDVSELYIVPSQSTADLLYAAAGYILDQSRINTTCEGILTALKNDKKLYFEFDNSGDGGSNETYGTTYVDYVEQENSSTVVNFIVNYNILAFYKVTLTKAQGATNWVVTYVNKSAQDKIVNIYETGNGNAVTNWTIDNGSVTLTKGTTFQEQLISGTNIKTIHNNSLLGSGNIELTASNIEVQNGDTVQDSIDSLTNAKQDTLVSGTNIKTINGQPIIGSGQLVLTSEDIKDSYGSTIQESLDSKQDKLTSGTNIKTVNGTTLLGSGNITIDSGVQYVEYADYEEMQADMSQESGTIGCDTNLYKYYIFNGQNETWDAITKVTDLRWIKTANQGTETYGRLLSDISNSSDLYVVNRAPASVEASNGTITVTYTDLSYIYTFKINSTGQISGGSVPIVTSVKNINGNQLSGSGNIVLDGSNLDYTGEERYHLHASETIDQSLGNLDTAIHNLDNIVGEEILTPTIVEHSYIVRDPAASRGNLGTINTWRVEVFKGLSEGEKLLVTYSGTDTTGSAQVAGWYTDGDNLIHDNYSYISNLNGYARNIVGKTYLLTVPDNTIKALALSLYTAVQVEVKRIGKIQAEIHGIENPNEIVSITTSESSASGGNNTVTITETNGTSHTFNVKNGTDGKDGADGVDLGEVALVQTTGDSEESVMSQKAVTEYGRKVTAQDLNGTSEWIRAKLTEEGWEFGKYLYTNVIRDNAAYCVTPLISINDIIGHSLTWNIGVITNQIKLWYIDANGTRTGYVDGGTTSSSTRTITVASSGGSSAANATHLRISLSASNLPQCYIFDNTTGEYIFRADKYISNLCKGSNLPYGVFEDNLLAQEKGDSTFKAMSQKAITDAINYNTNIENAEGFTLNSNYTYRYIKLTSKATSLLNASDKMTFMFSTKGTGKDADYRYFRFGNGSITANGKDATNGVYVSWSFARNLSANDISYTLNQMGSNYPTPDVWIVTWDRVNGIVRFYDHTTLVNTLSGDNYKKERFVNDEGKIVILGGNNNTRIYDIRLFDYDISYLFGYSDISNEIKNLEGAGILPSQFLNNYNDSDGLFMTITNSFGGGGYNNTCTYTLDGDDYHIVVKDTTTTSQLCGGKPYYLGVSDRAQLEKLEFEVVSGVIKHSWRNIQENENLNYRLIVDENGDEIADYDNIGVGKYTLIKTQAALGSRFDFYKVSGDVEVVINRNMKYKPISCVFHLRGDTMYNKKFYDDQTNSFITLYTDYTCSVEYIDHTLVKTPQRVIRTEIGGNNGLPHYAGEMAVVGDKVYIGMPDYTWKQINNS